MRHVIALYVGKLELFRDFVSRGFEQTLNNLTAIEIFEYLLLQLNKLSNFRVTSITWNYVQQPYTWDIKLLEGTAKSLELQLQLLNMSLRYFRVLPELHKN